VRIRFVLGEAFDVHRPQIVDRQVHTLISLFQILQAQDVRRPLLNELESLSQQVAKRTVLLGHDVAHRENAESHQLRKQPSIVRVVCMLEPVVLLDRRGVDQPSFVTRFRETVDQPVPVERRLHGDSHDPLAVRLERRDVLAQPIFQSSFVDDAIRTI
jgi:hypothetical protein